MDAGEDSPVAQAFLPATAGRPCPAVKNERMCEVDENHSLRSASDRKTSLVEELCRCLPRYDVIDEPYYLLAEEGHEFEQMPSLEDLTCNWSG